MTRVIKSVFNPLMPPFSKGGCKGGFGFFVKEYFKNVLLNLSMYYMPCTGMIWGMWREIRECLGYGNAFATHPS